MKKIPLLIFIIIVLNFLLYFSNFNAIGVVMDSRFIVVVISAIVLIMSLWTILRKRTIVNIFNVLLSVTILGFSINEYYLTYNEKEIVFSNDGYKFYGTLYTPKNDSSDCMVIFIHGSGQQDRNENSFHARQLARNNVASFAYDKRGSGKSEGDTYETDYYGYARDAVAAIETLKNGKNYANIGVFGISEGEWVSLIVDSLTNVDFIVMISASGTSPLNQTHREMSYRLENKGFSEEDIQEASDLYYDILTFDNDSLSRLELERRIKSSKDKAWFTEGEDFSEELYFYSWWNDVMSFSPASYLEKSNTDILVITGKENQSYPYSETVENFAKYDNVKTLVFDKGDHAMLDWKLGYGIPPPFFADGYLAAYTSWIVQKCN